MINYIVDMNGAYHLVKAKHPTGDWAQHIICLAPEDEELEWLDIIDIANPGPDGYLKKAVINNTKKTNVLAARQQQANADAIERADRATKRANLKAHDAASLTSIDDIRQAILDLIEQL